MGFHLILEKGRSRISFLLGRADIYTCVLSEEFLTVKRKSERSRDGVLGPEAHGSIKDMIISIELG